MDDRDNVWPLPGVSFSADLGEGVTGSFQSVDGLESDTRQIDYRRAEPPVVNRGSAARPAPFGSATLSRGIFANDEAFRMFCSHIRLDTAVRRTVVITLMDHAGAAKVTWTLNNAWPTKIAGAELEPGGSEAAVDKLELAYESLTAASP